MRMQRNKETCMFSQLRIRDMCTFYCCGHINKNKTKDITKPFFRKRMTIPTFLNKVSRCKGPKQSTVKKNNLVKSRCSIPVNSWLFSSSSSLSPLSQIFIILVIIVTVTRQHFQILLQTDRPLYFQKILRIQ